MNVATDRHVANKLINHRTVKQCSTENSATSSCRDCT